MSWFLKIIKSELENEWWKNIHHHMDEVLKNVFVPLPPNTRLRYEGKEPAYLPRSGSPLVAIQFSKNIMYIDFVAFKEMKQYQCFCNIQFNQDLGQFLERIPNRSPNIYHTENATGFENIQSSIVGAECQVKRRNAGEGPEASKVIASFMLDPQEINPYNVISQFKDIISSDWGDNGEDDAETFDPTPSPSIEDSPVLVGN